MNKFFLIILVFLLSGCSIVGPGQRGIRVSFGKADSDPLKEGLYFWFPVVAGMSKLSVQIQKSEVETNAASKDMQDVITHFALNWHINPEKVVEVYKTIGYENDVLKNIITPAISEVLKQATAKKTAEEILTKRHELKEAIDAGLKTQMERYGVSIDDVNIINVTFSKDFAHAVEQKQVAEQRAKQAEYEALQAKQTAIAEVNRAEGQSKAQNLLKQTLTPELLQLKAIEKWDGNFPQFMGGGALPFINLNMKGNK